MAATPIPSKFKEIKPIGSRVILQTKQKNESFISGILLPASIQKKSTCGLVVKSSSTIYLKNGDFVIYSRFAGTKIEVDGREHHILKKKDCICISSSSGTITDIKTLYDRVLVEAIETSAVFFGGILLSSL